jgi:DNA invertase Pin-like site-specific DNA recombinase
MGRRHRERGGLVTEVEQFGRRYHQAVVRRAKAMDELRAVVISAAEKGVPETELARQAGVDRMTVRRMLGKR